MDTLSNLNNLRGQVIRFNSQVDGATDFFENQVARIVRVDRVDSVVLKLTLDFAPWAEYNKQFDPAKYYDSQGEPRLKWHETSMYPSNHKSEIYIDKNPDEHPWGFDVVDDAPIGTESIKFHVNSLPEPAAGLNGYYEEVEVRLAYGVHDDEAKRDLTEMLRQTFAEFYDGAKVMTEAEWGTYLKTECGE